jgi:prepilin-type N-terminal cleavage/methylation domain-containing protein
MKRTEHASRGFTLVEIMVVVIVVAILTGLGAFLIHRIKVRTSQSLLTNNLRQLYQAKEFYFSENSGAGPVDRAELLAKGYLSERIYNRIYQGAALEAHLGWVYESDFAEGQPVMAALTHGDTSQLSAADKIYYPGPPSDPADGSSSVTPSLAVPTVDVPQPIIAPPDVTSYSPTVVSETTPAKPDVDTSVSSTGSTTTAQGGTTPQSVKPNTAPGGTIGGTGASSSGGPGNSDFGHSHNPGHGGH